MSRDIKIRRGLDIRLQGEAELSCVDAPQPTVVAIKPTDFPGLTPKMLKKAGEKVQAGEIVFCDKYNDQVNFASPVSGEIAEVVRGAKRRILEIRIVADATSSPVVHEVTGNETGASAIGKMLAAGIWPVLKQRPFDIIADPNVTPKAIFVTGFDSKPLAPSSDFVLEGEEAIFQKGLDVLASIAKVHLSYDAKKNKSAALVQANNVEKHACYGKHPVGNVGVQIHQVDPINKGETVFTTDLQGVLTIGRFFTKGIYDATKVIALTGSELNKPQYVKTVAGVQLKALVALAGLKQDNVRVISGNALTGQNVGEDGFLGFYENQMTVLPEGNQYKFHLTTGWLGLGFDKFSASRLFPTFLTGNKKYKLDTNINGEERAFVVTGELDKVFPFDILPMHLIKSIMYKDVEEMENLGIYEVAPEDFALCEYVCTSKIDIQDVVREGLDIVKEECA